MKRRLLLTASILVAVIAAGGGAEKRPVTFEDIMGLRGVSSAEIAPDGSAVLYTVRQWEPATKEPAEAQADEKTEKTEKTEKKPGRMEARTHIVRVPAAGGPARQLTFGERGETNPRWSPDGKYISFLAERRGSTEGDEDGPRPQIWIMHTDGGEPWQLTSTKEGVTAYRWAPDSKSIAFTTREPLSKDHEEKRKRRDDPRVFEGDFRMTHLWAVDVASKKEGRLTEGTTFTVRGMPTWSPDGKKIAFAAAPTPMVRDDRDDIYVVSAEEEEKGREVEKIASTAASEASPQWSPDGKTIAYVADPAGPPVGDGVTLGVVGNSRLMLYDVASKKTKDASSPSFDLSVGALTWDPQQSRSLAFITGTRASRDLFMYDIESGKYMNITKGRVVSSFSTSVNGARWAFVSEQANEPAEVWVSDVHTGSVQKITDTNPQVRDLALGETEVITWKSTDGLEVEGVLLKPVGFDTSKKYPLLVVVHGGPTGAFVNSFRMSAGDPGQHWAGQGWAVLYPNPRGSTNYGEKFMRGNIPDWGGGDYRDIMTGVDALVARGIADPQKLAVMGWSYGGYMTAWIVSQTTRFKAAMMGAGLSNLTSMYNTTDIPAYLGGFFKGIPAKATLPLYGERSAITYVDRVTTPLLILHGGNDERVPIGQPMEFYRALRDRGKTVELVFYPREGHGLSEYYHQLDRLKRQHEWIAKHTLGDGRRMTTQD
ncbi:MAG TPA: S9 family peptidase [Vicinamibacterales bacterium]|nr:S9 family peptidase [Vicinamibacterales bacterium]